MNNRIARFLLFLSLIAVILSACGESSTSTTEVDLSTETPQVEAADAPEETPAEEAIDETAAMGVTYPIVDTNQGLCYDGYERIDCPAEGEAFYGQDAQYTGNEPSYTDNGDGTITDNITGLVWTQEISSYAMPWSDAAGYCESLETGTVTDWRLPDVKELWSIRDFSQGWPWIDTDYFYLVGDGSDLAQHHSWSNNLYLVESEYQNDQVVGDPAWIVNDWTGHIKAMSGSRFVRCVSGDEYGTNDFADNGDGTVTDNATGLIWSQDDSGEALYWEEALAYAEDAAIAGYDDWRLPSAKELQSIADYTATEVPVLDTSVFNLTEVTTTVYDGDEVIDTQVNYPFYWSSTSNPLEAEDEDVDGGTIYAWALASGFNVDMAGYDLHGAGSIVFVSKTEENSGVEDVVPVMVRLVRDGDVTETPDGDPTTVNPDRVIVFEDGDTGMESGDQGGQAPDFAAAAATLDVTEDALMEAMGEPGQEPDFEAAAEALGVTAEELEAALSDSSGAPEGDAPEEGAPAEEPADSSEMPADSAETASTSTLSDDDSEASASTEQTDVTDAGADSAVIANADFEATDWTEETHGNDVAPDFEEVFDDTEVKRLDVVVSAEKWQLMLDDMTATYGEFGQRSRNRGLLDTEEEDPIWVPVDVFYNGTQWYQAGFRFKGNSSLQSPWEQGNLKLPFKLDFDEFEDDYPQIDNQRFYGFKQLSFKNNYEDESFLREKVAADIFEEVGLAVSHTAFYELYVDHGDGPEYFGLYTLVEEVDDTVIETQFTSDDGNLYKPEEGGANFVEGAFSEEFFEKKTNEDDADWSDILALFDALHDDTATTDPATWRANLEAVFDVDGFLKYLAVNGVIQNWDTYGRMPHNYYLYNDPETALLTWIPWDNNEAFQDGNRMGALNLDFSNLDSSSWPLIAKLYDDDVYRAQYDAYLLEVISGAFETSRIQALYDTYADLIEPSATAELPGFSFLDGEDDFANAIDELIDHAASRADAVNAYLGGQ